MKRIVIVKYDGIGDYLFFRMFWKQLSEYAKKNDFTLNFVGAYRFGTLMYKYDASYFENIFCIGAKNVLDGFLKERLLFFVREYSDRLKRAPLLKTLRNLKFDIGINAQFYDYAGIKKIFSKLPVTKKYAANSAEKESLDIYDKLIDISPDMFILERYRTLLSSVFNEEFYLPELELPFSSEEAKNTAKQYIGEDKYIVFIPYSSAKNRNWDLANFVKIAENISKISKKKIVLLGGGLDVKKEEIQKVKEFDKNPNIINLFNKTNLNTAIQIASAAQYTLTVDSLLMHCSLIGKSETVCLANGLWTPFLKYPQNCNVNQTIFRSEDSSVDNISIDNIWNHIKNNWEL